MNKTFGNNRMSAMALCMAILGLSSCVNEAYDIEKLNTEVTIAQSGLSLPIGTTEKLKVADLIKDMNQDMITQLNGAYALNMSGHMDLSKNLPNMDEMLKINDINFRDKFVYNLDNLNADGMVVDALSFETKFDAGNELNANVTIPQISSSEKIMLGLHEYAAKVRNVDLSSSFTKQVINSKATFQIPTIPPHITGEINVPAMSQNINNQKSEIALNIQSPDANITSISDIKIADNAKVFVKMELTGHEFLTKGDFTPDIRLEIGSLFGVSDASGVMLNKVIPIKRVLNKANNFTTTETYNLKSLNIKASDWSNGTLKLVNPLNINGNMSISNATTNKATVDSYTGNGEINMKVTITFSGVDVKSATIDLKEVTMNKAIQVPVSLGDGIVLPEQASSINDVIFTSNSNMAMAIAAENLNIRNLNAMVNSMSISFPKAMKVTGAVNGVCQIAAFDLKKGINTSFPVERIDFPASQTPGKLTWSDVININAQVVVSGKGINTADIPSSASNDSAIKTNANATLNVEDWHATIKTFENKLNPVTQSFTQNLSGQISDFGSFKVTPAGNPRLDININMPSSELQPKAGKDGLRLEFPKFIQFKNVDPSYGFDAATNTITFTNAIPQVISMNIDKLLITPEAKPDGSGHELRGEFKMNGSIRFDQGMVSGKEVDKLVQNGVKITASVPQIKPAKVELAEFKIDLNEKFNTTLIKGSELPAELLGLSEAKLADNVAAQLGISFANIPNTGGKELVADIKITLPKEIKLDPNDNRVKGNTLSIKAPIKNNKLDIANVKITEFDLSDYDFNKKPDLKSLITIDGKVTANEPSIDLSQKLKPIEANISAGIANIKFSKVRGTIDYSINPTQESVALTDVPEFLKGDNACLDIDNPYLLLKAKTNMGVPLNGQLEITPVIGNVEDKERVINLDLSLKGSSSSTKLDSTMLFIAAKNEGCPKDYEFVQCDGIKELIKKIPDNLNLVFNARTSTTEESVIEPNAKYTFDVNYSLVAPMAFGKDMKIELTDTLTGLGDIFPKLIKGNKLQLGGEVTNSLPLQLDLNVDLLDNNDNIIKLATTAKQVIKACGSDGSANTVPLDITLEVRKDTDLTNFKGLLFTFNVTSGNVTGIPVTEKCFVQAKVTAKLPEGANIDFKDFENKENQTK